MTGRLLSSGTAKSKTRSSTGSDRRLAVGRDGERPLVDAGRPVAAHVDLDPQRLPEPGPDREREAAAAGPRVLGHELHGLPARRVARRGRASRLPGPVGVALRGDVHVVDGEELDRPSGGEARVARRRRVGDRLGPAAPPQLRERGGEGADAAPRRPRRSPGRPRPRCGRRRAGRCGRPRRRSSPSAGGPGRRAPPSRRRTRPTRRGSRRPRPARWRAERPGHGPTRSSSHLMSSGRPARTARGSSPLTNAQRRGEGQRDRDVPDHGRALARPGR